MPPSAPAQDPEDNHVIPTPTITTRTTGGERQHLIALNARVGQTLTPDEARDLADQLRDLASLAGAMH